MCVCIIPTFLYLVARKSPYYLLLVFWLKSLLDGRDLLMILCCDVTGLVIHCSSVELIKAESLNSTVLFTNNTSNVSELYGNGTNLTVNDELFTEDDNYYSEIVRLMRVYGRPPIIVLETLGNLLTFIVMRRGSMRHVSTCFYMAILALADMGQ